MSSDQEPPPEADDDALPTRAPLILKPRVRTFPPRAPYVRPPVPEEVQARIHRRALASAERAKVEAKARAKRRRQTAKARAARAAARAEAKAGAADLTRKETK